ncbi:MAG: methyltransferase domain-containing protein [Candidatus Omnitrophota bacterium]
MEFENYQRGGKQKNIYTESEVVYVSCPLCGKNSYKEIYQERGALRIVECLNCSLIYVNPRLKEPEEIYWGDEEKYFKEARLIFEGKARHHRDINYQQDLKLISKYKPSGNFLDVGTNMGFFLRNALGRSWNLYGVEPSPSLSAIARRYLNLNVKTALLEDADFEDSFFDVITLIDVFEHLYEPAGVLKEVRRILKPDGIVFIKVPNALFNLFKYYCARFTKRLKNYDIFDSYEHVVHYSQKTLILMLRKFGFKIIGKFLGKPIQIPVWHNYVGQYYQYPTPWRLDYKRQSVRSILYYSAIIESKIRLNRVGYLAPNIIGVFKKEV